MLESTVDKGDDPDGPNLTTGALKRSELFPADGQRGTERDAMCAKDSRCPCCFEDEWPLRRNTDGPLEERVEPS